MSAQTAAVTPTAAERVRGMKKFLLAVVTAVVCGTVAILTAETNPALAEQALTGIWGSVGLGGTQFLHDIYKSWAEKS